MKLSKILLFLSSFYILYFTFFVGPVSAQSSQQCSFRTVIKVYKDSRASESNILKVSEIGRLEAANNKGQSLPIITEGNDPNSTADDLLSKDISVPNLILGTDRGGTYNVDQEASVTLNGLEGTGWKVKDEFCFTNSTSLPASRQGCPSFKSLVFYNKKADTKIEGFRMNCGVDITYGWILEKDKIAGPTAVPTKGVQPPGRGALTIDLVVANKPQDLGAWDASDSANKPIESCTPSTPERPRFFSVFKLRADCVSSEPDCQAYDPKKEKDITVDKRKGTLTFPSLPSGTYAINVKGIQEKGYKVSSVCKKQTFTVTPNGTTSGVMILENFANGTYSTTATEGACTDQGGKKASLVERARGAICFSCAGKDCKDENQPQPTSDPNLPTNTPTSPPTGRPTNKPAPTSPPEKVTLQCNRSCIYSQINADKSLTCHRGACPAGAADCGKPNVINAGCMFAGEGTNCSIPAPAIQCPNEESGTPEKEVPKPPSGPVGPFIGARNELSGRTHEELSRQCGTTYLENPKTLACVLGVSFSNDIPNQDTIKEKIHTSIDNYQALQCVGYTRALSYATGLNYNVHWSETRIDAKGRKYQYSTALMHAKNSATYTFIRKTQPPAANDILIFNNSSVGHMAYVKGVTADGQTIQAIEANFGCGDGCIRENDYDKNTQNLLGWLRKNK